MAEQESGQRSEREVATRLVVGVEASAWGLEALEAFFEELPAEPGMSFVVIDDRREDTAGP